MGTEDNVITRDRLTGGLYGLLAGDALGVPYEFNPSELIPALGEIEFEPPGSFRRSHFGTPPGTWSDDGAQALVLLDSLLDRDGLDLAHFANGLLRWQAEGFFAVDRRVFDIGIQTSTALSRLRSGADPQAAGPASERDNGNGGLMRVLPLALWCKGDERNLIELAMQQSLPTHGHLRSQFCCAQLCLWARAELQGRAETWDWAAEQLRALADPAWIDEIERVLSNGNADHVGGSGYVLDTLWSARHCLEATSNFEGAVRHAIALGHDTDTTAAVAGGVAGVRHGRKGIPQRWIEGLRGIDLLEPLLVRLLDHAAPHPPSGSVSPDS